MSTDQPRQTSPRPTDPDSLLDGPPEDFLDRLLRMQCSHASVISGAVLHLHGPGKADVLASHPAVPEDGPPPSWLTRAVEIVSSAELDTSTTVIPLHSPDDLYGQPAGRQLVVVNLPGPDEVAAFVVNARKGPLLDTLRERLQQAAVLVETWRLRRGLVSRQADLERMCSAMAILSSLNGADRYHGACMALVNELSSRFDARRVSLGFLHNREVKLAATSHTEKFSRKMQEVQDLEAAMEECLDQDLEVVWPAPEQADFVYRATEEMARKQGGSAVVSLPLRRDSGPVGVVTLEREADRPFEAAEVEVLRLTADLCTARLTDLKKHDRWFGARLAADGRQALGHLVGPRHTWMKLAAIGIFAAALFLIFVHGPYRAEATFVLEPARQRVVPAPFDGFLQSVAVEPDAEVSSGQELARLDTAELEARLARAANQLAEHRSEVRKARRDDKPAEAQIAEARARQVEAEIELLRHRLAKATITSPIDGVVIEGDLRRSINSPVEKGQVLFRIAPLGSRALRAAVMVPEDQVADLLEQMERKRAEGKEVEGRLTLAADPTRRISIVVERVDPVAQVVKGSNVFRVVARLEPDDPTVAALLRPGQGGVARIELGRAPYGWIWTRKLTNWVRMKLWI